MYSLTNNHEASKFDLYSNEQLVASLHYAIDENEMMFFFCEAVESHDARRHCTELMGRALEEVVDEDIKTIITCPIALKFLKRASVQAPFAGEALRGMSGGNVAPTPSRYACPTPPHWCEPAGTAFTVDEQVEA